MARVFTLEMAEFYEKMYRRKGIQLESESSVASLERAPGGGVSAAVLRDGRRLPCDMVAAGVGVRANVSLFEGQLAMEQGGIRVDSKLESSTPGVFAVGDVACFPVPLLKGSLRRVEHVDHARKSACQAVRHIINQQVALQYNFIPFFYSRVFSMSWQLYGDTAGTPFHFGLRSSGKFGAYWVAGGHLVGAFLESGTEQEYRAIRMLVQAQPVVPNTSLLGEEGSQFALKFAKQVEEAMASSLTVDPPAQLGSPGAVRTILLSNEALQAWLGVVAAAGISMAAYSHGRRTKKW